MNIEELSTKTLSELDETPTLLSSDHILISRDTSEFYDGETIVQSFKVKLSAYIDQISDKRYATYEALQNISNEIYEYISALNENVIHQEAEKEETITSHNLKIDNDLSLKLGSYSSISDKSTEISNILNLTTTNSTNNKNTAQFSMYSTSDNTLIKLNADRIELGNSAYLSGSQIATIDMLNTVDVLPKLESNQCYAIEDWQFKQTPDSDPILKKIIVVTTK